MARIRLVLAPAAEVERRKALLQAAGHEVLLGPLRNALADLRADGADAVLIDLGRAPASGRDLGLALRCCAATRRIPLVFVGGLPDVVDPLQELLPDAVFTHWDTLDEVLPRALAAPPLDPVVPASRLAGYAGTPLTRKLGIRAGTSVGLLAAPPGIADTLGPLPAGATMLAEPDRPADLIVFFARTLAALAEGLPRAAALAGAGGLWIAWTKQAAHPPDRVTEKDVRRVGLAAGLVDCKVCSVDASWSALRFVRRRPRPSSPGLTAA